MELPKYETWLKVKICQLSTATTALGWYIKLFNTDLFVQQQVIALTSFMTEAYII